METKQMYFEDGKPVRVVVEMEIGEAAAVAKAFGGMSYSDFEVKFPTLPGETGSEIYGCLVGETFNRYWDAGVDGFLNGDED